MFGTPWKEQSNEASLGFRLMEGAKQADDSTGYVASDSPFCSHRAFVRPLVR